MVQREKINFYKERVCRSDGEIMWCTEQYQSWFRITLKTFIFLLVVALLGWSIISLYYFSLEEKCSYLYENPDMAKDFNLAVKECEKVGIDLNRDGMFNYFYENWSPKGLKVVE